MGNGVKSSGAFLQDEDTDPEKHKRLPYSLARPHGLQESAEPQAGAAPIMHQPEAPIDLQASSWWPVSIFITDTKGAFSSGFADNHPDVFDIYKGTSNSYRSYDLIQSADSSSISISNRAQVESLDFADRTTDILFYS